MNIPDGAAIKCAGYTLTEGGSNSSFRICAHKNYCNSNTRNSKTGKKVDRSPKLLRYCDFILQLIKIYDGHTCKSLSYGKFKLAVHITEMGVNFPFLPCMSSVDIYDNVHFTWETLNSNAYLNWVQSESSSNLNEA